MYITTKEGLVSALNYLKTRSILALDTETNGLDPLTNQVLLVQVGDQFQQFCFDVYKLGPQIYELLEWIKKDSVLKVAHNAKFDYCMIKSNFNIELENIACTMIGSQLLSMGRKFRHSLDIVAKKFVGVVLEKTLQKSFADMKLGDSFTDEQIQYSTDDIQHLIPIYNEITKKINARNMRELAQLEYEVVRVSGDMELNGIYIDKNKWLALKDSAQKRADAALVNLNEAFVPVCQTDLFGDPTINYDSPVQLKPALEELLGIELESTNANVLESLRKYPAVKALLAYREAKKKVSTYGEAFLNQHVHSVDNRVHASFHQLGAGTGRFAGAKPNLMNIPKEAAYRAAFTAQYHDYKIIAADFSGQELRLLAHLSREPKFIYALKNNMDLHSYSASLIFGIDYKDFFDEKGDVIDEMKKKYRNPAKSITFGLVYGMGPTKLAATLGITMKEARDLMNKYFKTFPQIKVLMDQLSQKVKENKYTYSPLDHRRMDVSHIDWDNPAEVGHVINEAKNMPFQGCGASTTKLALVKINNNIKLHDYDAKIINVVHDEILLEVHEDDAEEVAKMVEVKMVEAFNHYANSVPMSVVAEIGDFWIH